jgi:hypothetical protein
METKTKRKIVLALALAVIVLTALPEISEAARWQYHAWRNGHVTVWGTRNCHRVTNPLVYRRYMHGCQTIGGYLPWWCNDWMVRLEWGYPCYNVTWQKYVARPCPYFCWWRRWGMGLLDNYFGDYLPHHYYKDQFTLPILGNPYGYQTPSQYLYTFVDLGQWLDADANSPYTPLPPGSDPNTRYYYFSSGTNPDLPGYTVMTIPQGMEVEDLIRFDPNADPNGYPFVNDHPEYLFNGTLYLESEQTFTSEPYNGYLMEADNNMDGVVNFYDLANLANLWLRDVNNVTPVDP